MDINSQIVWMDLPVSSRVPNSYGLNTANLMKAVGANLGNLVFRKGLQSILDTTEYVLADPWNADSVIYGSGELPKHVVISCANWVGSGVDFDNANTSRASILGRASKLSIIPIGLGIQANSTTSGATLSLGAGTLELLRVLSQHSEYIGVRCGATAMTMRSYGIENIRILGCPSNFITIDVDLRSQHLSKLQFLMRQDIHSVRWLLGEPPNGFHDLPSFLSLAKKLSAFVVAQTSDLITLIRHGDWGNQDTRADLNDYSPIKQQIVYFCDVDQWLEFAASCDFYVGHRIHGAMAALQAGTPACLIAHDLRTRGLAETMKIPCIMYDEIKFLDPIELRQHLYGRFLECLDSYHAERKLLAAAVATFFKDSSIPPSESFLRFLHSTNS